MKTLLPLGLLLCVLGSLSAAPVGPSMLNNGCCVSTSHVHVPRGKVIHIGMSSRECPVTAIIITTEKRQFCIDPDLKWAKTQLAHFKASTTSISHPKHQPTIRSFVHRDDKQNTTESPK
uniref:Chemokine interleukin-8-like domain-containing protein n=1 Tax=Gasterosteus aculeatus aculeatus TaxID=481459 RepID=A0AAQ4R1S3_GASAC